MSKRRWHYVYTLLDEAGTPLYVGLSMNVAKRIRGHYGQCLSHIPPEARARKAEWFCRVRSVAISGPYTHDIGWRVERERIERLQPIANVRYLEGVRK